MTLFGGGGYGRRGGFPMRWILALIIAGIGLFTYFRSTQVNPVTGEKQRIAMSVDQEKSLGLSAAPQMASQMGGALDPRNDADARVVAETGHKIVSASDAQRSPYVGNYNFYLLGDPETVNAFALPGGQIFITKALYTRLETEAQLAGVLGHEIGHVVGRHSAEHMAKGQLGQMIAMAVGVGASDERGRGYMAAAAAQMASQMLQLKYGRQDELEADSFGMKYMAQAGYDPSQMRRVMQILKEAAGTRGRGPSIFATHPDPDARVEQIEQYIKTNYPNGVPKELSSGKPLH
jgi:beta-barrel assembly-enhancing protease